MLSNLILKRFLPQKVKINIVKLSATTYNRYCSNEVKQKSDENEIKSALDIEASLFDNSALQHAPVSARETLRALKTHKTNYKKNVTAAATKTPTTTTARRQQQQPQPPQPATVHRPARAAPPLIKDSELGLEFVRLSLQDSILSTLLTTARSRKRRDKNGQIIIEGRRLIDEALTCGLYMETLIFSQRDQLALLSEQVARAQKAQHTQIYKVPQHDLKTWSTLTTPPGLLGIFKRPTAHSIELRQNAADATPALPITVVCDNIREPNNLGSILRTCAALPCQQVVVTRGCCDPWESKALRGGCGAHFRLVIHDNVDWTQLVELLPNETVDDCHVFVAENNWQKSADSNAQTIDYAGLTTRTDAHNLVIIGGESHGVSAEAYKFLDMVGDRGKCLYIPLAEGIDSLNVTSALTLILFELRKKLSVDEYAR